MKFRYPDGSLFDGAWEDAPAWDVQTIAYWDPRRGQSYVVHNGDYYHLAEDGTVIPIDAVTLGRHAVAAGVDVMSLTAYQLAAWGAEHGYKIGLFLGYHQFQRVYQLGKKDRDSLDNP